MMRLWIFSDMHFEFSGSFDPLRVPDADLCVVAGDVLNGCANSVHWLARTIAPTMPVVFVAGNHESYRDSVLEGIE